MKLRWKGNQVKKQYRAAAAAALRDAAEFLKDESNKIAPVDEGTLINSSFVAVDDRNLVAVVAYDTPYAIIQHERLYYRHRNGRQAKYLERPIRQYGEQAKQFVRNRIQQL